MTIRFLAWRNVSKIDQMDRCKPCNFWTYLK
jgi:hypothetical protein